MLTSFLPVCRQRGGHKPINQGMITFHRFPLAWIFLCFSLLAFPLCQARAETCFHACFSGRKLPTDVTDQTMRETMQTCRDACEKAERQRLIDEGLGALLKSCIPEQISDAELKQIRSASSSVVAFANAFTWDVNNVLPDKIIRRVELTTQTMSLADIDLTSSGYVAPGHIGTFYMGSIADGYPAARVTTRIKAVYACPSH
jgi:hypothetical protein